MSTMWVQCAKCGVTAKVTPHSSGFSFQTSSTLALVCPVIREKADKPQEEAKEWDCPNLQEAVERGITEFHQSHP
jgi:hypothetical protein